MKFHGCELTSLRKERDAKIQNFKEYPNSNSDVKGVLVMMGYLFSETFIDAGEPALMMINHEDATLNDGVTNIIREFEVTAIPNYGTDVLYDRAIAQNFKKGKNLEYIRMENNVSGKFAANYASLSSENYDKIASFFYNLLD